MHEQHNNAQLPRTAGAITIHPTVNAQASYYFMSLYTDTASKNTKALRSPIKTTTQ